ncbi:MAG: peptidoglycan-binding protein, partial [Robiginitomaculum sp.]|nr:peptidoglycan-binding protein [Robiginitomaculum sp.]
VQTPASSMERIIPAVTKTVTRRVVDVPARTERREIPARYDTVSVQRLVDAARIERIVIPAKFGTIEKRVQTTPEKAEWRQVLCEANSNSRVISAIQTALKERGYYRGAIDGILGQATYASVEQFQIAQSMSTGGLTLRTVDALGVDWRSMVSGGGYSINSGLGYTVGSIVTTSTGTYTIGTNGQVLNAAGAVIGRLASNGSIVGNNGQVLGMITGGSTSSAIGGGSRFISGASSTISSGSRMISGASGASSSSMSLGNFSVRANGQVVNSAGVVLGTVDANGNIIDTAGKIIGRVGN